MSAPGGSDPVARAGGGMFEVNIAEAPRAIRELERAREELEGIKRDAVHLGHIDPQARDDVSVDAARALMRTATDGPESFFDALTQGIAEIQRMVDALRSGFEAYQLSDQSGRHQHSQAL